MMNINAISSMRVPPKSGKRARQQYTRQFWYDLFYNYKNNIYVYFKNKIQFLSCDDFHSIGIGPSHMSSLSSKLDEFDKGLLVKGDERVKNRATDVPVGIYKDLVHYIKKRQKYWESDKLGLNLYVLKLKAKKNSTKL